MTEFQSSVPRLAEHLPEHAHLDELNYLSALLSAMDGGDAIINQGGELTRFGYIYNNRSPFTEYYNGRDVPEEYRVTPTPPEPEREGPDFEAAAPAAPRPVAPILLASDKPGDKMKEITGRLEQGIT